MNKFKILYIVIFLLMQQTASAQFVTDFKRNADRFYAQGDYYSAAIYYEKYLNNKKSKDTTTLYNPYAVKQSDIKKKTTTVAKPAKGVSISEIMHRIAEGYKSVNDYKNAENWYSQVAASDKANYPLSEYNLGVCQRANAKYNDAEATFTSFLSTHTTDDEYSQQAKAELANLKFLIAQKAGKEKDLFKISKTAINVNQSQCGSYAPFVQNGILYFTSTSKDTNEAKVKNAPYLNNIYISNENETLRLNLPTFESGDQGTACFTPNGNTIFFTRRKKENGKYIYGIYKSTKNLNGVWSEPEKLSNDINVEGYISKQPNVSKDGKYLLFASNMPGGFGKFDLWYSAIDNNGNLSKPSNFGASVNSKEDEEAPFYHVPSMQLVFASKGRIGMGGFDLFTAKGLIGESFTAPTNIGYPINTEKDDIYFYSNDDKYLLKNFYMSSDRESVCLEMYSASKIIKKFIGGKVVDSKTLQPLNGVSVNIVNENGKSIGSSLTDADGKFIYETDPYNTYQAKASKEDYKSFTDAGNLKDFNADVQILDDWKLEAIEKPVIIDTPPPAKPLIVRFEFDKFEIEDEYKPSLDSLAALLKREPNLTVEIGGYTDEKGSEKYNLKLSGKRAKAGKDYLVKNYGIDAKRLSTKAYGKCCPIEKEVNEDGTDNEAARKTNRRLEFRISGL
ncbi:MAG: OmpA family protein [Chitinophagaceae bacterium]